MDWNDATRKVVIAGTGRSGTTFLVQLLTLLDLPTGVEFANGSWLLTSYQRPTMDAETGMAVDVKRDPPPDLFPQPDFGDDVRAGLEYHVCYGDDVRSLSVLPKIIKNPRLASMLERLLEEDRIQLDHVLACVRDLKSVARSKFANGVLRPQERYYQKPTEAIYIDSAIQLGRFTATLLTQEVPHTFLVFPRMAREWRYLYDALQPILPDEVTAARFRAAHQGLARMDYVNHGPPGHLRSEA